MLELESEDDVEVLQLCAHRFHGSCLDKMIEHYRYGLLREGKG